jgi:ABC-type antimicrobial peptide transport system ATPase subunit
MVYSQAWHNLRTSFQILGEFAPPRVRDYEGFAKYLHADYQALGSDLAGITSKAIVLEPAIVLADEPTENLDSDTTDSLLALMSKMNEQFGITFIVASHEPRVIGHTRRKVRLRDGKVVADEVSVET